MEIWQQNYEKLHLNTLRWESYLYINETEICKFKTNDNISWYNSCLESIRKDFTEDEQSEILLNANV